MLFWKPDATLPGSRSQACSCATTWIASGWAFSGPDTNVWALDAMEAGAQICRLSMNRKALTMAEPKKTRSVPGSVLRRIAVR